MIAESLEWLDKFLRETPKEELDKLFDEVNKMQFEGPTAKEYFESFDKHFNSKQ